MEGHLLKEPLIFCAFVFSADIVNRSLRNEGFMNLLKARRFVIFLDNIIIQSTYT